jgi:hypothetical protein
LQKAVRLLQAAFRRHLGSTAQRDSRAHSAAECLLRFVVAFHGQSQLRLAVKHVQRAGQQLLVLRGSAVYTWHAAATAAAAASYPGGSQHMRPLAQTVISHSGMAQRHVIRNSRGISLVCIGCCSEQVASFSQWIFFYEVVLSLQGQPCVTDYFQKKKTHTHTFMQQCYFNISKKGV